MPDTISNDKVIETVRRATHEVFETMLGLSVSEGQSRNESGPPDPTEGVLALIGMAGDWVGTGTISGSADTARFLAGKFLMQEFTAVDEEVLDAIGELSNMIFGNVKTTLEEQLGPMGLSIPTVIFGRNFTTRSVGNHAWIVIPFEAEDHHVEFRICLCRRDKPSGIEKLTAALSVLN